MAVQMMCYSAHALVFLYSFRFVPGCDVTRNPAIYMLYVTKCTYWREHRLQSQVTGSHVRMSLGRMEVCSRLRVLLLPFVITGLRGLPTVHTCNITKYLKGIKFLEVNFLKGTNRNGIMHGIYRRWSVLFFLVGDSLASEFSVPTFRNILSVPTSWSFEQPKGKNLIFKTRRKVSNEDQVLLLLFLLLFLLLLLLLSFASSMT